jgi:hypothetical protein
MTLGADLVGRIERALETYGAGRPIPAGELRDRLRALALVPDEDYEEFVGRETCIELTTWARGAYGHLIDGVVIADDGSGNPIWIAADRTVRLVDHDRGGQVVQLAPDFRTLLEDNVHD